MKQFEGLVDIANIAGKLNCFHMIEANRIESEPVSGTGFQRIDEVESFSHDRNQQNRT